MGETWVGSGGLPADRRPLPTGRSGGPSLEAVELCLWRVESVKRYSLYAKVTLTELDLKNDRRSRLWIPLLT